MPNFEFTLQEYKILRSLVSKAIVENEIIASVKGDELSIIFDKLKKYIWISALTIWAPPIRNALSAAARALTEIKCCICATSVDHLQCIFVLLFSKMRRSCYARLVLNFWLKIKMIRMIKCKCLNFEYIHLFKGCKNCDFQHCRVCFKQDKLYCVFCVEKLFYNVGR